MGTFPALGKIMPGDVIEAVLALGWVWRFLFIYLFIFTENLCYKIRVWSLEKWGAFIRQGGSNED